MKNLYDVNIIGTNAAGKYKWKILSFLFKRRNICQIINPQFTKVNDHNDYNPDHYYNIFFPGFVVDTCGPPKIQNTMMNQTVVPGEYAHFKCQVCMMMRRRSRMMMMVILVMVLMMMNLDIDFEKRLYQSDRIKF